MALVISRREALRAIEGTLVRKFDLTPSEARRTSTIVHDYAQGKLVFAHPDETKSVDELAKEHSETLAKAGEPEEGLRELRIALQHLKRSQLKRLRPAQDLRTSFAIYYLKTARPLIKKGVFEERASTLSLTKKGERHLEPLLEDLTMHSDYD